MYIKSNDEKGDVLDDDHNDNNNNDDDVVVDDVAEKQFVA